MSSALSFSAIHRIIFLVENDERLRQQLNKSRTAKPKPPRSHRFKPHLVHSRWCAVYILYKDVKPAPPLDYFHSLELALVYKGRVDDEDVRAIFAHGKPLEFWGCPRLIVSKIVEAFSKRQKEPAYLDVTINALDNFGAMRPSEAWPQVYTTRLPCHACTTMQTVQRRTIPRPRGLRNRGRTARMAVEKFHIASESFGKWLTVELHYELVDEKEGEKKKEKSSFVCRITIRLDNATCAAKERPSAIADRSRPTRMLVPDVACGVYGFLDRAHIGSSLLANGELHDIICQLQQQHVLPVHHLTCGFDKDIFALGCKWWLTDWLMISHCQRDLPYTDLRSIELAPIASAEDYCGSIRHYLSNCHVDVLAARADFFRFAMKMLPRPADRNFSIGCLELATVENRLSDYRSMDRVFGEMQMDTLNLVITEHRFVELVKITDFLHMSTIQGLRRLDLLLIGPSSGTKKITSEAVSKNPIWLSGINLLRNCEYFLARYEVNSAIRGARRLRLIERSVVCICEAFERGETTDTVEHFVFVANCVFSPAFSRDNLLVSGMIVEGHSAPLSDFEWDVYRFRNASNGEYLTACVGRHIDIVESSLHILKGEVYPNASFAL